jgi:uncharacterized membrane protein YdbT with pleckstrin-like domain
MSLKEETEKILANPSPQMIADYGFLGPLPRGLSRPGDINASVQAGLREREHAQLQFEVQERAKRKERQAKQAEADAAARRIEDEKAARANEVQLEAQLRREYPNMSDAAWKDMWPSVRRDFYAAAHQQRMAALTSDVGYERY